MKKILIITLCLMMSLSLLACNKKKENNNDEKEVTGSLSELMAKIYETSNVEGPIVMDQEITDETKEYYLGSADVNFTQALASDAMMSAVPHSIVLLRVADDSEIESTKKLIKDNANPRKWICVGVEDSNVVVDNIGTLIILIMSNDSEAYHTSFKSLAE